MNTLYITHLNTILMQVVTVMKVVHLINKYFVDRCVAALRCSLHSFVGFCWWMRR